MRAAAGMGSARARVNELTGRTSTRDDHLGQTDAGVRKLTGRVGELSPRKPNR